MLHWAIHKYLVWTYIYLALKEFTVLKNDCDSGTHLIQPSKNKQTVFEGIWKCKHLFKHGSQNISKLQRNPKWLSKRNTNNFTLLIEKKTSPRNGKSSSMIKSKKLSFFHHSVRKKTLLMAFNLESATKEKDYDILLKNMPLLQIICHIIFTQLLMYRTIIENIYLSCLKNHDFIIDLLTASMLIRLACIIKKSLSKSKLNAFSALLSKLTVTILNNEPTMLQFDLCHLKAKQKISENPIHKKQILSSPFSSCHIFEWFVYPVFDITRLASYRPLMGLDSPVSFLSLSGAGFSYSGNGHAIVCQGCGSVNELQQITLDPSSPAYHHQGCAFAQPDPQLLTDNIEADSATSTQDVLGAGSSSEASVASHSQLNIVATSISELATPQELFAQQSQSSISPHLDSTVRGASVLQGASQSVPTLGHPSYPIYLSLQKRLESFARWPVPHIQNSKDLAEAGFFYAGYVDCVRCFQCGLGLRSWKPGDNVNTEHERFRPSCPFLRAQRNRGTLDLPHALHATDTSSQARMLLDSQSRVQPSVGQTSSGSNRTVSQASSLQADSPNLTASVQRYIQESPDGATAAPTVAESTSEDGTDEQCDGATQVMPAVTSGQASQTSGARAVDMTVTKSLLDKENLLLHQLLTCKVCRVEPIKDLFLPCGDLYTCARCSQLLTHCPVCKKRIMGTVTIYFS